MSLASVVQGVFSLILVATGLLCSFLGLVCSTSAQSLHPPASTMVTLLSVCSCLPALSGIPTLYQIFKQSSAAGVTTSVSFLFLEAPHDMARSVLSTANAVVIVNKAVLRTTSYYLDPKQFLLGFFGLMAACKIITIVILPETDSLGPLAARENRSLLVCSCLESLEGLVEVVCLGIMLVHWSLRMWRAQEPEFPAAHLELGQLPPVSLLIVSRASLYVHLVLRFLDLAEHSLAIPVISIVVVHSILGPAGLIWLVPSLRLAARRILTSDDPESADLELRMEEEAATAPVVSVPPTRPSSDTLPQLMPGAPETRRIKYKSNIRKHRSALETVVSAPRLRKGRKTGKGPLDGAMLDMVGEKIIPLEVSDSDEDESNCRTM